MATIGSFTKVENGFIGEIATLSGPGERMVENVR